MMRLGLIAWDYPPSPSGLSTAAREIAESLVEAGHDVRVFTLDRSSDGEAGGVRIVGCAVASRLARLRQFAAIGHLAAPAAFRRTVMSAHRRQPLDLVEATNWYAPAVLLAGRAPFPLVTRNSTPAGLSRGDQPASLRNRLDGAMADALERRQARSSDGLLSNTAAHRDTIAGAYGQRTGQPHAVCGLSLPPEMMARGAACDLPPLGPGEPLKMLFVGRAELRKGYDLIMEAVLRLAAMPLAHPLDLTLVGVDPADVPAAVAATGIVHATGRLPGPALEAIYAGSHVVLAPSRYESFGLVYQEALAYGRPVIACRQDDSAVAFIGRPGAGILADATGASLAGAIATMIDDGALREALSAAARRAAGRFDRGTLAADTLDLYRKAIAAFQAR